MAYYITDECISCGSCEPECPNEAISEGDSRYVINPDRCTECIGSFDTSRCAAVCPVDAPQPDPDRPEGKERLLEKWRALHPGAEPAAGSF